MFKVNEGTIDRVLRVTLGIALVALALTKGWMWAWIGVVPILTGATGICPLYSIFGINTCGVKKA
ncbi:MAG: YgaP family membrane protein [Gemmatimonadaceae bacterium]